MLYDDDDDDDDDDDNDKVAKPSTEKNLGISVKQRCNMGLYYKIPDCTKTIKVKTLHMNYAAFDRYKPHWLHPKELHYSYAQFNMKALRTETLLALSIHELQFVDRGVHNHNIIETNIICVSN
jgi:hypothetical protein